MSPLCRQHTAVLGIQSHLWWGLCYSYITCWSLCCWNSWLDLKLNGDKSELLVFHTKHSLHPDISNIMVGEEGINPAASCSSIGVMFDDTLTFETHQFCLQDFILALEVHLEDSHLPGQVIIGNSHPCLHYKQISSVMRTLLQLHHMLKLMLLKFVVRFEIEWW